MLSTPGSSSPSQEGREMSHSPQAPAQGLTVQLEQGVATLEADFRQEMHRKLALRNFLLTTAARLGSLPCCPQGRALGGLQGAATLAGCPTMLPSLEHSSTLECSGVHCPPTESKVPRAGRSRLWLLHLHVLHMAVTDFLVWRGADVPPGGEKGRGEGGRCLWT